MNEEQNARLRAYRQKNGDAVTKKYEKTKSGKLMRTYRNMQSRVLGIAPRGAARYTGKNLPNREDFYRWSLADESFNKIFTEWEASGYNRKLSPSIDRIDPYLGYAMENLRWLTLSENSKLGGQHRKR